MISLPLLRAINAATITAVCSLCLCRGLCDTRPIGIALHQTAGIAAAEKLFNDDKYDDAKSAYKGAIKATPKNAAARVGLLRTLYWLDDWRAGITEAKAAEAALPQNPDFKGFESIFLMRGADPDAAIKAADAAMKAGKDNYWALLAEGRSQAWQYHYDAARKLMRQAIGLQPAIEEGYAILISTFSEVEAAEEHRVEEDLRLVAEKAPSAQASQRSGGGR